MKSVPEVIVFDSANGVGAESMVFGPDVPVLIDPNEAITLIGTGTLSGTVGLQKWTAVAEKALLGFERAAGRWDLAEELVISSVRNGRVRCAYATRAQNGSPRLSYVDPAVFNGRAMFHGWDDGLWFELFGGPDDVDHYHIEKFWFFWEDILALVPRREPPDDAEFEQIPDELLNYPVESTSSEPPEGLWRKLAAKGDTSRNPPNKRGRGREAGKNGEPMAMFVLRVQEEGIEKLNELSGSALGAMLEEEYERLGLPRPNHTNAARDARGVLRALVKMRAKMGDNRTK